MGQAAAPEDPLPYRVEACEVDGAPERVIGRAASLVIARAIFSAAQSDFAGRRIVLYRDAAIVMESTGERF